MLRSFLKNEKTYALKFITLNFEKVFGKYQKSSVAIQSRWKGTNEWRHMCFQVRRRLKSAGCTGKSARWSIRPSGQASTFVCYDFQAWLL